MSELGRLNVVVTAGTADFKRELATASTSVKEFGSVHSGTMREGVGAVRLLTHELGVPLPRELARLIAHIPAVGAAFTAMLPVIGVVAAISVISKLIEKHEELISKQKAQKAASAEAAMGFANEAKSIELTNLKLEDQLAKLEKKPKNNAVAEALLENEIAMDKFVGKAATDLAKLTKDTEEYSTVWSGVKQGLTDVFDDLERAASSGKGKDFLDTLIPGATEFIELMKKLGPVMEHSLNRSGEASDRVQKSQANLTEATLKYRNAKDGTPEKVKALNELNAAYDDLTVAANAASKLAGEGPHKETNAIAEQKYHIIALQAQYDKADEAKMRSGDATRVKLAAEGEAQANAEKAAHDHIEAVKAEAAGEKQAAAAAKEHAHMLTELDAAKDKGDEKPRTEEDFDTLKNKHIAAANAEKEADITAAKATQVANDKVYAAELADVTKTEAQKNVIRKNQETEQAATAAHIATLNDQYVVKSLTFTAEAERGKRELGKETERERQEGFDETLNAALASSAEEKASAIETAHSLLQTHNITSKQEIALKKKAIDTELAADETYFNKRIGELDRNNAEELKKIQKFEDEKRKIEGRAALEKQKLDDQLKKDSYLTQLKGDFERAFDGMNQAIAKTLVEGKNFGKAMRQVGEQLLEAAIEQALKEVEIAVMTCAKKRLVYAETAASKTYSQYGWPEGIAPAAAAFAEALGFAQGGLVPGSGGGDTVPAMLTPGETVVTKALTQQVAASQGSQQSKGGELHMHFSPTVSAIDASGVDKMLDKHAAIFQKKMNDHIRKMNASRR